MFSRKGKKKRLSFSPSGFNIFKRRPQSEVKPGDHPAEDATETTGASTAAEGAAEVLKDPKTARGYVERYLENSISGWAYEVGANDDPTEVSIYFDGTLVGKALADRPRPDVKRAGHETEKCGFEFIPAEGTFADALNVEVKTATGQTIGLLRK